jgi:pilus assembly protein CpaE
MASSEQVGLLLIEDVPQVAKYIRSLLAPQAQIRLLDIVDDGSRVLEAVAEHRPDVIMVDALLQGRVRGMALIRQLYDSRLGLPVIVLTVPQHPVRADPSRGIDDVISMPFNGYDLINKVMNAHQSTVVRTERGPSQMVAVFGPKGGVGRTTIAYNLASAAVVLGTQTVLVDGNIQFADLRGLLRVPEEAPSLLDLPTDHVSDEDLDAVLWREPSGLDVLLAPPRIEMGEMVSTRDVEKVIAVLRRTYDLIVVDVGINLDEINLAFLDNADNILQVVGQESAALRNIVAIGETFAKIGYPDGKVRHLVNRAGAAGGVDQRELAAALGKDPDHSIRSDWQVVITANNRGVPFVISDPDAPVSRDVLQVARDLLALRAPVAALAR